MTIALPRHPHSDWLARLRTISLGLGGRGVMGLGLARSSVGAAAPASWWLAGGAPAPVAVYQPKGAADYAASKVNLAQPGTYNAADGTAYPTWASATGWTFNGISQYLMTGVVPGSGWSLLIRIAGSPGENTYPIGEWLTSQTAVRMGLRYSSVGGGAYFLNGGILTGAMASTPIDLVASVAGQTGYLNGSAVSGSIPAWSGSTTLDLWIGALNYDGGFLAGFNGQVLAIAIYNTTLSAAQVLAITNAMNLL